MAPGLLVGASVAALSAMVDLLRPELTRRHAPSLAPALIAVGALCGASVGAAIVTAAIAPGQVPVAVTAPAAVVVTRAVAVPLPLVLTPAARPDPRGREIHLVATIGHASYLALTEVAGDGAPPDEDVPARPAMPRHGRFRLLDDATGPETAVATVRADELDPALRAWAGRLVTVDGTCTARVTGFAIVARLTGDPAYAGEGGKAWSAARVARHGDAFVAARLDGCTGTTARDAALAPAIATAPIDDPAHVAVARARLLASPLAAQAQDSWRDGGQAGAWTTDASTDYPVTITTQAVRHLGTGATWITVHAAVDGMCGGPDVNLWGLYRVTADGAVVTVAERHLDRPLESTTLLDVDGDGTPEVISAAWDETTITTAGGDGLARTGVPFYGCVC
jgi:hypothetical protein